MSARTDGLDVHNVNGRFSSSGQAFILAMRAGRAAARAIDAYLKDGQW